jgi:hypothetical protein
MGKAVFSGGNHTVREGENRIEIHGLSSLGKGCYILECNGELSSGSRRAIKIN